IPLGIVLAIVLGVLGLVVGYISPKLVGIVLFPVELILVFLVSILFTPLALRAGLSQSLALGATFGFARDFFGRVGKELVLVQLFLMVSSGVVAFLGMLACCVGLYVAIPVIVLAQSFLFAQLYRLYLARGGAPIPLKEEPLPAE